MGGFIKRKIQIYDGVYDYFLVIGDILQLKVL
jgi:hypothetical protein